MLNVFSKVFGTRNDRVVKKYKNIANEITNLEAKYSKLSDDELKAKFNEFIKEVFAITREASVRSLGLRPYDVQLIGAMVLNDEKNEEMKTGEGKTLVGAIAVCLNALSGKGVHVVTVNDYLATRDANELKPLYEFLGYSVGA